MELSLGMRPALPARRCSLPSRASRARSARLGLVRASSEPSSVPAPLAKRRIAVFVEPSPFSHTRCGVVGKVESACLVN